MNDYPKFHVFGPRGWINDPNGLIFFKGLYHVFYQYYPYDVRWGPMHWGHAVSSDLRNWTYLEPALCPDDQDDGCFSGSAIEVNGLLYLVYTSFTNRDGLIRQQQAIALSSDGIYFEKKGLVITSDELPSGYAKEDFRDPSVIKEGDSFSMYVASRMTDGRGRILIFKSKDLFHWKFEKDLFEADCIGTMIECPDRIGDVLTFSEQFFPSGIDGNCNIHASRYIVGDERGNFSYKDAKALDYGFDFYAAQTFKDQRILIGWLNMWDRSHNSESLGFVGELTYPRRLTIKNGDLYQIPYLDDSSIFAPLNLKGEDEIECKTGIIHIRAKKLSDLKIKFNKGETMWALLSLQGDELVFDRSQAKPVDFKETDPDSAKKVRKMPFDKTKDEHEFYFVLDNHSVEIFADGKVLSSLVDTDDEKGKTCLFIKAEDLKGGIVKY